MTAAGQPSAAGPVTARLRLDVAYDGTDFSGWAVQPGRRTVQGTLEDALGQVLRTDVSTTCAGRTDAGVHARGQVCHVDVDGDLAAVDLRRRLAAALPADVRVRAVRPVDDSFDARFSALWRRYSYRVCDDAAALDPLRRREVLAWRRPVDLDRMDAASAMLLGEHDFAAFCRKREGATTIRRLVKFSWSRRSDGIVVGDVVADAFCHNMVRSLVGAVLAVGDGRRTATWPAEVLAGRRRHPAVVVVAPHGLTLEEVGYPPEPGWGARASTARDLRVAR